MNEDTTVRPTIRGGQTTIRTPKGGDLKIPDGKTVTTRKQVSAGDYGVAFDGLELTAYPKSTVAITALGFGSKDSGDGWFGGGGGDGWFAALPGTAAARPRAAGPDDESRVTRRDVLRTVAAAGGAVALTKSAMAASNTVTRAHVDVASNPAGLRVRVLTRGAAPLPTGTVYGLTVQDIKYDQFNAGPKAHGDIPPTLTGTVAVAQDVSALAFFKAISGAKAIKYDGLKLPKNPVDVPNGTKLTITDHDILVRHIQKAGGDDTTLEIGGTSIPHYSESKTSPKGWWGIRDDAIVYEVGPKAPASTSTTLTLYAGAISEYKDDASRVI